MWIKLRRTRIIGYHSHFYHRYRAEVKNTPLFKRNRSAQVQRRQRHTHSICFTSALRPPLPLLSVTPPPKAISSAKAFFQHGAKEFSDAKLSPLITHSSPARSQCQPRCEWQLIWSRNPLGHAAHFLCDWKRCDWSDVGYRPPHLERWKSRGENREVFYTYSLVPHRFFPLFFFF